MARTTKGNFEVNDALMTYLCQFRAEQGITDTALLKHLSISKERLKFMQHNADTMKIGTYLSMSAFIAVHPVLLLECVVTQPTKVTLVQVSGQADDHTNLKRILATHSLKSSNTLANSLFCPILTKMRQTCNLTMREAAKQLDTYHTVFGKMEKNEKVVDMAEVVAMSNLFKHDPFANLQKVIDGIIAADKK